MITKLTKFKVVLLFLLTVFLGKGIAEEAKSANKIMGLKKGTMSYMQMECLMALSNSKIENISVKIKDKLGGFIRMRAELIKDGKRIKALGERKLNKEAAAISAIEALLVKVNIEALKKKKGDKQKIEECKTEEKPSKKSKKNNKVKNIKGAGKNSTAYKLLESAIKTHKGKILMAELVKKDSFGKSIVYDARILTEDCAVFSASGKRLFEKNEAQISAVENVIKKFEASLKKEEKPKEPTKDK